MLGPAAASAAAPSFNSRRTPGPSSSRNHLFPASTSSFFCAQSRTLSMRRLRRPNSAASGTVDFAFAPLSSSSSSQDEGRSDSTDQEGPELDFVFSVDEDVVDRDFDDGFQLLIEKRKRKNRRRIRSRILIDADLETVWGVLTDYEGLATFIPSLAVSQLLDKRDKFARVYQVGRQDLALGLKFDAKGVIDCYERDLEMLPGGGRRRDIDFEMVEGDFETFEGKWSIKQIDYDRKDDYIADKELQTELIYVVDLQPKLWLPVGLIEGRICMEVKNNLLSVREEAQRIQRLKISQLSAQ